MDVSGRNRKYGSAVDMGAYERYPLDSLKPFDLVYPANAISENQPIGTVVGHFNARVVLVWFAPSMQ